MKMERERWRVKTDKWKERERARERKKEIKKEARD